MLQPPRGRDNHDESFASWYHQPCPIHRAQVVASRGRGGREEEGMNCVKAGSLLSESSAAVVGTGGCIAAAEDLGN